MTRADEPPAPVCAALRGADGATDALFGRLAEWARGAGLSIAGTLQSDEPRSGRQLCDMTLDDLVTGRRFRISEDRGDLAEGCRLDSAALTEAAALVERTIREAAPDLVILSKFGKAEAEEGAGLRDAIAVAIELDVPVLTSVSEEYREALRQFAGELCVIAADEAEVRRWLRARLGERAAAIVV